MSMTWVAQDDTQWVEKAMDEYHGSVRGNRLPFSKRNWKFSDLNQTLQSVMLRRAAELKAEFILKGGR
jgi:hypothetical protein